MKETTIYLIRHAEAEGNVFRRFQGHTNVNLTARGVRQLEFLRARMHDTALDAVYCSDLTRACRTAKAVADDHGLPIRKDPRFREVFAGACENLPVGAMEHDHPEQYRLYINEPAKARIEGAERMSEYTGRMLAGLKDCAAAHEGGTLAVVAHGSLIAHTMSLLFPDAEIAQGDNTSVTKLRYDGAFHADYFNDTSHVPPELSTGLRRQQLREKAGKEDLNLWFQPYEGEIDWYLALADDSIPVAPMAVLTFGMQGEKPVGLLQLDPERDQELGAGFIDYIGVKKNKQGIGFGRQLLGEALYFYRALGRTSLRAVLPAGCESAGGWLLAMEFVPVGDGVFERDIRVPEIV